MVRRVPTGDGLWVEEIYSTSKSLTTELVSLGQAVGPGEETRGASGAKVAQIGPRVRSSVCRGPEVEENGGKGPDDARLADRAGPATGEARFAIRGSRKGGAGMAIVI
jgi:hypothetical protein